MQQDINFVFSFLIRTSFKRFFFFQGFDQSFTNIEDIMPVKKLLLGLLDLLCGFCWSQNVPKAFRKSDEKGNSE